MGEKQKEKRTNTKRTNWSISPSHRDQTHLLEVWHVQQGSDFKCVKKLREVFKGMLGSVEDGAEAGNDIQQGLEQGTCFRRYQSLAGQKKRKNGIINTISTLKCIPWAMKTWTVDFILSWTWRVCLFHSRKILCWDRHNCVFAKHIKL